MIEQLMWYYLHVANAFTAASLASSIPEPLNPVKLRPSPSRNLVYSLSTVNHKGYEEAFSES
ncbi:hypothetical protein [Alistipes finegoldii]|uniref:Uncharacterized protein n=1 Tax=Alistipes finegoldii TaxID=214856 RepID=A0AAE4RYF5_9BACT|nr:hypothetical protein [Alistipes finegoldii]MCG4956642.1 hypothetical protein [Alistipes finegoldii]MDU0261285.1 hypothetical protein [Alistipes finegoldii]